MGDIIFETNVECVINAMDESNPVSKRLIQMGVLPGSRLRIVRVGPLGKTVEVLVDQGESIAMRTDELKLLDCKMTALPLSAVKNRQNVYKIRNFLGGRGFAEKMRDRNLTVGDRILVKKKNGYVLLEKTGKLIRIGRGEAEKIMVEPVED